MVLQTKLGDNISKELWETAWTYIKTVVDTAREPFLILDSDLCVITANESFYDTFKVNSQDTEKQRIYDLGNGQWNIPKLRELLEDILPKQTFFKNFEVQHDFPGIGQKIMLLNARQIHEENTEPIIILRPMILLAMEDITDIRNIETKLAQHAIDLEFLVAKRTAELEERVRELERVNKIMVNRELKMIELKKEIENLKALANSKPKKG